MLSLPSPRRARTLLVAVVVALGAWLLAPAAAAHDVLIDSFPEEGEVLTQTPQEVTLTFNNEPLDVGAALVVEDADGESVAEGEGVVEGTEVRLELTEPLPGGEYTFVWRVASSDGHPIEGRIAFGVEAPASPTPTEPATEATENPPATEATTEAGTVVAEPSATTVQEPAEESDGLPTWVIVVVAIVAVGAVGALIVTAVRRQRNAQ